MTQYVYVGVWGSPLGWRTTTYTVEEEVRKDTGAGKNECNSFSTTPCFANAERIIILVMDSILTPDQIADDKKECLHNIKVQQGPKGQVVDPSSLPNDYKSWYETVKDVVQCILGKLDQQGELHLKEKSEVLVAPAIGSLGKLMNDQKASYGDFKHDIIDAVLTLDLYRVLKGEKSKGIKNIVLDITHGINYFTILSYEVVKSLASILGFTVTVVNAIPSSNGFSIKEIEKFSSNYFDVNDIRTRAPSYGDIIDAISYNGILALWYLCQDNLKEYKIDRFGESDPNDKETPKIITEIDKSKGVELKRQIWKGLSGDKSLSYVVANEVCEVIRNKKPTINDLKRAVSELRVFSDVQKEIIRHELYSIENSIKAALLKDEKKKEGLLKDILPYDDKGSEENLRRNFIAHGGLLKDKTKFEKQNDDYKLEYVEDVRKLLEKVRKASG